MPVDLSIIVPVYRVERFVGRCIESILAQTFEDFELILIDDGSDDRSGELCDEYAKDDERVKVIHQSNRGVSVARNIGLLVAQGDYVMFIDADDYIAADMCEIMIGAAQENHADIVCCNWGDETEQGNRFSDKHHFSSCICDGNTFVGMVFDMPPSVSGACSNKLFRREQIDVFFEDGIRICEDVLFLVSNCSKTCKAVLLDSPLYIRVWREESVTRANNGKNLAEEVYGRIRCVELAEKISTGARNKAEKLALDRLAFHCREHTRLEPQSDISQQLIEEYNRYIANNRKQILNNHELSWKHKLWYLSGLARR